MALMEVLVSDVVCLVSRIRGNTDLIFNQNNGFHFDINENTSQSIYSIIHEIENKEVCFDESVQ